MRRSRYTYTLARLVALIVAIAVGLAALREANALWDALTFSLAAVALLAAALLAIHRPQPARAFWLGFAIWGSAYLAFSLWPATSSRLITSCILAYLDSIVPHREVVVSAVFGEAWVSMNGQTVATSRPGPGGYASLPAARFWSQSADHFANIGHALFSLACGAFGGWFSRAIHADSAVTLPAREPGTDARA